MPDLYLNADALGSPAKTKKNHTQKDKRYMIPIIIHEESRKVKFIEAQSGMWLSRAVGIGVWGGY